MLKIFGQHGALVDDKDRIVGRFNDWLETKSFILGEEILWAGDHRTTDKLKSMITADTIQLERKQGNIWQSPNHLDFMLTTNHDHAVAVGVGNRRYVVYELSDERACDKTWFDPIYRDLEDGGAREFLYLLQNLQLGSWHPREILRTAEATEQQRMTSDSVSQWAQACINADAIIGDQITSYLGTWNATEKLQKAYAGYCRQQGLRPANETGFGKACVEMFGSRKRHTDDRISHCKRRSWGYDVPTGEKWQKKLDKRLGIKS
jgi:hypothetical protein